MSLSLHNSSINPPTMSDRVLTFTKVLCSGRLHKNKNPVVRWMHEIQAEVCQGDPDPAIEVQLLLDGTESLEFSPDLMQLCCYGETAQDKRVAAACYLSQIPRETNNPHLATQALQTIALEAFGVTLRAKGVVDDMLEAIEERDQEIASKERQINHLRIRMRALEERLGYHNGDDDDNGGGGDVPDSLMGRLASAYGYCDRSQCQG